MEHQQAARHQLIEYISRFLCELTEQGLNYEYYYLNKKYPECTINDMSDEEIAQRFPLSGERLVLDCFGVVLEYAIVNSTDYESFIRVIEHLVKEIEREIKKQ